VQGLCSFGNVTNGILVTDGPGGNPQGAYRLSSAVPGGSAGQVTVSCNQYANLQVSAPIQTAGPTGNRVGATVSSPYNTVSSGDPVMLPYGGGSGPLNLYAGSTPLSVNLAVEPGYSSMYVPPGNYAYKVTLTVTP
jgi:hypothetical protein